MTDKYNHTSAWCQMKYKGTINHMSAWCQKEANQTIRQHGVKKRQIKPYVSIVSKSGKLNHISAWCQTVTN